MSISFQSPDLTQHPPRSARGRLGGYVILPRMLDKCRAELAGKNGEYHYNCPMDQHFLSFAGINADELKAEVAKGRGDWEILEWVQSASTTKRSPWEINQWSEHHLHRGPDSDAETLAFFTKLVSAHTQVREDIRTWFDALDLDDYCSFGGQA